MVRYLKKAIGINPKNADALNYLGYSYAEKGIHLEEAYSLINSALELKPDSGSIMDSLGWVYFKMGKSDEALKVLLKALELVKDDPVVFEHVGDVYNSLSLRAKAREYWGKAIEFNKKGDDEGLKERVEKKVQELQNGDRIKP